MPTLKSDSVADSLESCIDAIGEFVAILDRYDDATLAFGLSAHLEPWSGPFLDRT